MLEYHVRFTKPGGLILVESHVRSVMKAMSWRIVATLTTVLLVFIFTRSLEVSFGVGLLEFLFKIVVYYLHERVWNIVQYGRKKG
jgi:adenylylsulfate kinase